MHCRPYALTLIAALSLGGCAARAATTNAPVATPVTLATATAPASQAQYAGPGAITPQHVYHVAFEIPGRIIAVNADVGDRIAHFVA